MILFLYNPALKMMIQVTNTFFSLSIRGTDCHKQGITNKITLHFIIYTNEFLKRKIYMLQKGSFRRLEYLYYINDTDVNENTNGSYFEISNCTNDIQK